MAHLAVRIAIVTAVAVMVATPAKSGTAMTCLEVDTDLLPCLGYIKSGGDTVPPACCSGLNTLVEAAKSKDDRQTACNCLKQLAEGASDDEVARAAAIPDKCGIFIPFKISKSIDCSKVN